MRVGSQSFPSVGQTTDGKDVIAGVYDSHQSLGMPLDFLFAELADRNKMPDWLDFYWRASDNGMKHDRILSKIKDPIEDAWGVDFAKHVISTLDQLHKSNKIRFILKHYILNE